jgi:TetR/AcrR family transcriptional regulator, tetracycline repressor protein
VLLVYVIGSIALEVAELGRPDATPTESERVTARRAALDSLPARTYPRTMETADAVSMYFSTEQFLWGLNRVLDGLEPSARR